MDMSLSKLQEFMMNREAWSAAVVKSQTRLSDWTEQSQDGQNTPQSSLTQIYQSESFVLFFSNFFLQVSQFWRMCTLKVLVAQSCPGLCNPMDCSLPGFSIHGVFQARTLECVAISFSGWSSRPNNWTWVSYIDSRFFTVWATREVYPIVYPGWKKATFPPLEKHLFY